MNDSWGQFLRNNFDKVMLFLLLLIVLGVVLYLRGDKDNIGWAREQTGTVLGALLGLITGAAFHKNEPPKAG
jgi:hypothetical protein